MAVKRVIRYPSIRSIMLDPHPPPLVEQVEDELVEEQEEEVEEGED